VITIAILALLLIPAGAAAPKSSGGGVLSLKMTNVQIPLTTTPLEPALYATDNVNCQGIEVVQYLLDPDRADLGTQKDYTSASWGTLSCATHFVYTFTEATVVHSVQLTTWAACDIPVPRLGWSGTGPSEDGFSAVVQHLVSDAPGPTPAEALTKGTPLDPSPRLSVHTFAGPDTCGPAPTLLTSTFYANTDFENDAFAPGDTLRLLLWVWYPSPNKEVLSNAHFLVLSPEFPSRLDVDTQGGSAKGSHGNGHAKGLEATDTASPLVTFWTTLSTFLVGALSLGTSSGSHVRVRGRSAAFVATLLLVGFTAAAPVGATYPDVTFTAPFAQAQGVADAQTGAMIVVADSAATKGDLSGFQMHHDLAESAREVVYHATGTFVLSEFYAGGTQYGWDGAWFGAVAWAVHSTCSTCRGTAYQPLIEGGSGDADLGIPTTFDVELTMADSNGGNVPPGTITVFAGLLATADGDIYYTIQPSALLYGALDVGAAEVFGSGTLSAVTGHVTPATSEPADLVVDGISTDPPAPVADSRATIVATVTNAGGGSAGRFVTRFFVDNVQQGPDVATESLLPGASIQVSQPWIPTSSGTPVLLAVTDAEGQEPERDETNNDRTTEVFVGSGAAVDLSPPAQSKTVAAKGTAAYTITVTNTGVQTDTIALTTSESKKGWSATLSASSVTLAAGASTTIQLTVQASTAGSMTVTVTGASQRDASRMDSATCQTQVQK
jgi:hypothetical protein